MGVGESRRAAASPRVEKVASQLPAEQALGSYRAESGQSREEPIFTGANCYNFVGVVGVEVVE